MKKLFEQIKLEEGTSHWTENQQKCVHSVIEKYSFLFAMDSLDLGWTDLIKHHIDPIDYTPIKDRYRRIPLHEGVFEKLAKAGLKLKPSKCEFFKSSLKYLSHIISRDGIATDPKKIEGIINWPTPRTVTDVHSFTNYHRKFIKGYAKIKLTSGENGKKKKSQC